MMTLDSHSFLYHFLHFFAHHLLTILQRTV